MMATTNRCSLRFAVASTFLATALTSPLFANTTNQVGIVGAGKKYTNIQAAVSASANGDVVEVYPGTYIGTNAIAVINNSITIRGIGTRPVLDASSAPISNDKAIFVAGNNNVNNASIIVENLEFTGANGPSNNDGGIRPECTNLVVRNCYFHNNQNGIQGGWANSSILFEYCEFADNGYGDGYTHNIYIGSGVASFTMRYCYSHSANQGHLLKSRANTNYILYNRITEEADGLASYEIQLPQGGLSYIVGNLIEKGVNAVNHAFFICYADENQNNPIQNLYVANNTIVNDCPHNPTFFHVGGTPGGKVVNNIMIGPGTITDAGAALVFTNNLSLSSAQLVNASTYNYQLIPFSSAIDWGVTPGVYSNFDLTPSYVYVHPTTCAVRQVMSALDVGAYEATDPASSYLHLASLCKTNNNLYVNWLGNNAMSQILECKTNLADSTWMLVSSNAPGATPYYAKAFATNSPEIFFRIRATH